MDSGRNIGNENRYKELSSSEIPQQNVSYFLFSKDYRVSGSLTRKKILQRKNL